MDLAAFVMHLKRLQLPSVAPFAAVVAVAAAVVVAAAVDELVVVAAVTMMHGASVALRQ